MERSGKKNNYVEVVGSVIKKPEFAFKQKDDNMYSATLGVSRLSGTVDEVPVILNEELAEKLGELDRALVIGSMRTHNTYSEQECKNKMSIFLFAKTVYETEAEDRNIVNLIGTICKTPSIRQTPLNKTICDLVLAVNTTKYHSDYIPTICWQSTAHKASHLVVGDKVEVDGRFQSRPYTKVIDGVPEDRVAYELCCNSLNLYVEGAEETYTDNEGYSEDYMDDIEQ